MKRYTAILLAALFLLVLIAGCSTVEPQEPDAKPSLNKANAYRMQVRLYYPVSDGVSENGSMVRSVPADIRVYDRTNLEEIINKQLTAMIRPPKPGRLSPVFPENMHVEWVSVSGDWVGVRFSHEFMEMTTTQRSLARCCTARAVFEFAEINYVQISVDDSTPENGTLKENFAIARSDIFDGTIAPMVTKEVLLCLPDKSGFLVPEKQMLTFAANRHIEDVVAKALFSGENRKSWRSILPDIPVIEEVQNRNGICTVHFDAGFAETFSGSAGDGRLLIYAIVNSLAELDEVAKVRFTAAGSSITGISGFEFGNFVSPDKSIIKK